MTVAVAVCKQGRIVMAADSLVNFGGQRFTVDNARFHKIRRIGESLLAWAGWSVYGELLTAHLESHPALPSLDSESHVFDFFINFWRSIRTDYTYLQRPYPTPGHPFAELDSEFLLANRHGIFRIAGDMDVSLFRQYSAVGSGSAYALGALRVLYRMFDDPADIAHRAVEVGIEFEVHCGGMIDLAEVGGEVCRQTQQPQRGERHPAPSWPRAGQV